jgi:phosphoribosyl-dephospho-CoA transferase
VQRHDLLRVDPGVWQGMLHQRPDLADLPMLGAWASRAWPVIVRRRMAGDPADGVPVALPLPPRDGKRRLGFSFASGMGIVPVPAVRLSAAAACAPAAWQPILAAVLAVGAANNVVPGVFGSLLWEHLTRQPYVSARSDIDLLWHVADGRTALSVAASLAELETDSPVRLDGEFTLPDGGGVNWREFAQAANGSGGGVMVKTTQGVELRPLDGLFCRVGAVA